MKNTLSEIEGTIDLIKEIQPRLGHEIEKQLKGVLEWGLDGESCLQDFLGYATREAERVTECDDLGFYD